MPAGWLALCYLGFWLALALERVCAPIVLLPLLGAPVLGWRVSAFRVTIENAALPSTHAVATLALAAPFVLETTFLTLLAGLGGRVRPAVARIWLHFAGLWTVLQLAAQVTWFAYAGRGALAQLAGQPQLSPASRIAWAAAAALLLLAAGRVCAGGLVADAGDAWSTERRRWLALPAVTFPVLPILAGAFNIISAIHYLGPHVVAYVLVPVGACFVLALLGLTWKRAALPRAEFSARGAWAAVCLAAAFYAGLEQAPRIQPWLAERGLQSFSSAHYQILYDPKVYSPETIRAFAEEREQILAAAAAQLDLPLAASAVHLRVVLYPNLASLRAAAAAERPYSVEGTTIRAVLGDYNTQVDPAADAAALLDAAWGPPGTARMGEWVARWLAGTWRGREVNEWAAQIEGEVGHYTVAQLVASSSDGLLSPLVRNPLGAAWVGTIFDRSGLAAVRKLYSTKLDAQLGAGSAQLENDWQRWTARLASTRVADPLPRPSTDANFFFRGISFSHEGWSGRGGGYLSAEADTQLRQIRALGANAIAVVPYGFARNESISYTDTDETDEALTHALHVGRNLGMKVMLKPQLWVRGGYTGTLRFDNAAARAAWMRQYREFILHYARLAELEQFDLLSIGTEFESLTAYQDDWRRLIAEVRRVYHGPLTYAANWGREFESLAFWDALDYMGVNDYYPLGAAPSTRAEDLLPGAERVAARFEAMSRRWRKPILFTEVGYPSVRGGSSEPWVEDSGREVSLEEQSAAYRATFQAFAGKPWFRGMFWWKWPSSGRGGGPRDASFTPLGKPATEVLRAWFTRLAAASPTKPAGPGQPR